MVSRLTFKYKEWRAMKEYLRDLNCIDLHVAGEPFRLVTNMFEDVPGTTMLEKKLNAEKAVGHIRELVLNEPRGHKDMYGGFLVKGISPESHFGVLFIHSDGFSSMCGHGIVAVTRAAVHLGLLDIHEGWNEVRIDTPAAPIKSYVRVENDDVEEIYFSKRPILRI